MNETVAVLRDQVENLRAELANLRARREQDMHHVESLLKERDEALVKLERANALLGEWYSLDPDDENPARSLYARTEGYLSGASDTASVVAPVCGACGHRASKPCGADDCPLQDDTNPRI